MAGKFLISVIGGHECDEKTAELAREVGKIIAEEGAVLISGGLGGVMEAVSRGVKEKGGITVGIIPTKDKNDANSFIDIAVATGMGHARNSIVAGGGDLVVAFPGLYGTLSEIGFALSQKKPVYGFGTWDIPDVIKLNSPEDIREIIRKHAEREENTSS